MLKLTRPTHLPKDERTMLLDRLELAEQTPNTATDWEALEPELIKIRERGASSKIVANGGDAHRQRADNPR
jgi:DNA-binding IclR family transcriptional regulator